MVSTITQQVDKDMSEVINVSVDDGLALITIERPRALNALNSDVLQGLDRILDDLSGNEALRCIVVTGAGEKAFVAGADIAQMAELTPRQAASFAALGHQVFEKLSHMDVPVIAAVNGFCLGGGCELALACDLVYASENAQFGQPEVKLGLIPGFGGTQRLARRVGAMRALELTTTARMVKADEARAMGLCLDVFAADGFLEAVIKVARTIAKRGPVAVRLAKKVQRYGLEAPLAVGNAYEADAFGNLFDSADAKEGMRAFLEKRNAQFENR